jgi:hypothetical protein
METQIIRPQATLSMKLNFPDLCQHHNITPRGIILIGAYDGKTLKRLNLPNTVKILVIDANQGAVERLQENFAGKVHRWQHRLLEENKVFYYFK